MQTKISSQHRKETAATSEQPVAAATAPSLEDLLPPTRGPAGAERPQPRGARRTAAGHKGGAGATLSALMALAPASGPPKHVTLATWRLKLPCTTRSHTGHMSSDDRTRSPPRRKSATHNARSRCNPATNETPTARHEARTTPVSRHCRATPEARDQLARHGTAVERDKHHLGSEVGKHLQPHAPGTQPLMPARARWSKSGKQPLTTRGNTCRRRL